MPAVDQLKSYLEEFVKGANITNEFSKEKLEGLKNVETKEKEAEKEIMVGMSKPSIEKIFSPFRMSDNLIEEDQKQLKPYQRAIIKRVLMPRKGRLSRNIEE